MDFRFSSHQHKSRDQTGQTKKMISVQMGNKNMLDSRKFYFIFSQLHLRSFTTINQKNMSFHFQYLSGWMCRCQWSCRMTSENGKNHKIYIFYVYILYFIKRLFTTNYLQ